MRPPRTTKRCRFDLFAALPTERHASNGIVNGSFEIRVAYCQLVILAAVGATQLQLERPRSTQPLHIRRHASRNRKPGFRAGKEQCRHQSSPPGLTQDSQCSRAPLLFFGNDLPRRVLLALRGCSPAPAPNPWDALARRWEVSPRPDPCRPGASRTPLDSSTKQGRSRNHHADSKCRHGAKQQSFMENSGHFPLPQPTEVPFPETIIRYRCSTRVPDSWRGFGLPACNPPVLKKSPACAAGLKGERDGQRAYPA